MAELINLITVGVAVVCIVLAVGSRDRIRALEFRLALIERRFREGQAESTATPPTPDTWAQPRSSIVPEPPAPEVASEPVSPDAAPQPLPPIEPASPPPVASARPSLSLEERFGTQ